MYHKSYRATSCCLAGCLVGICVCASMLGGTSLSCICIFGRRLRRMYLVPLRCLIMCLSFLLSNCVGNCTDLASSLAPQLISGLVRASRCVLPTKRPGIVRATRSQAAIHLLLHLSCVTLQLPLCGMFLPRSCLVLLTLRSPESLGSTSFCILLNSVLMM